MEQMHNQLLATAGKSRIIAIVIDVSGPL
jgi:hypothetical protein